MFVLSVVGIMFFLIKNNIREKSEESNFMIPKIASGNRTEIERSIIEILQIFDIFLFDKTAIKEMLTHINYKKR